jgi:urease accessory protein
MTLHQPLPPLQRAEGAAAVSLALRDGRLRLGALRQRGSAKVILPAAVAGARPEVVFLNTAGGLTGGDRLSYGLTLGDGVAAVATTQTAERAYRSASGEARVEVALSVGEGGHLDWLPQETILFDGSALIRRTTIDLAAGASCLALDSVILGRPAMGERVGRLMFADRREVRRAGRLVSLEPLALGGDLLGDRPAILGGARAFAALVLVAGDAADRLAAVRAALDEPGCAAGASAFDGRLVVRMMAGDGWPLRRQILRALSALRPGAALPRVWQI